MFQISHAWLSHRILNSVKLSIDFSIFCLVLIVILFALVPIFFCRRDWKCLVHPQESFKHGWYNSHFIGTISRGLFLKIEQQLNFWLSKDSLHIYFDDHEQPSKSAVQNNSVCQFSYSAISAPSKFMQLNKNSIAVLIFSIIIYAKLENVVGSSLCVLRSLISLLSWGSSLALSILTDALHINFNLFALASFCLICSICPN